MFLLAPRSLRASAQFGGDHEKWTRERHVRGDAKAGRGGEGFLWPLAASLDRSRVLARLASLAQIGELACTLLTAWDAGETFQAARSGEKRLYSQAT